MTCDAVLLGEVSFLSCFCLHDASLNLDLRLCFPRECDVFWIDFASVKSCLCRMISRWFAPSVFNESIFYWVNCFSVVMILGKAFVG